MPQTSLVWLRRDLRLHDHEPLTRALERDGTAVPVFCFDPRDFATTFLGAFPRTGAHRARFLLASVAALRTDLRQLGGDLVVRVGRPEVVLPELAEQLGARVVHAHEEVASEERAVEQAVDRALASPGASLALSWGSTLIHREDLPFGIDELPELFTGFRRVLEKQEGPRVRSSLPSPSRVPALPGGLDPGVIPTLASLGLEEPAVDPRSLVVFEGGERAGLARLETWTFEKDALGSYKETRNGLLHPDDSSKLSPWLAHGCLSPRAVHDAVRRYESARGANDSTYWMIFELYWRDYFRFAMAKHGDLFFRAGGLIDAHIAWYDDAEAFARWRTGQTGYPLVDAAMRELAVTGYTSNRARQNVASFLTKNLGIDWRLGASWFESQLLDYDVASNWGNWAYAGGVGNDARGFRFFNLRKQAEDYDPSGDFARHWLPELAALSGGRIYHPDEQHEAELTRCGIQLGKDYPRPMVHFRTSAAACERGYEAGVARAKRRPGENARRR